MTKRERQLLNWIEENPLISQKELADKAGITRSSVAVHISNLMKRVISPARATLSRPPLMSPLSEGSTWISEAGRRQRW